MDFQTVKAVVRAHHEALDAARPGEAREVLRARVARGHVTLSARVERDEATPFASGPRIDDARLDAYVDAYERLQRRKAVHTVGLDFAHLVRLPGVLVDEPEAPVTPAAEGTAAELVAIVEQATGRTLLERKGLTAKGEYAERNEATGRREAIEELINDIIEGAQSQW